MFSITKLFTILLYKYLYFVLFTISNKLIIVYNTIFKTELKNEESEIKKNMHLFIFAFFLLNILI